MPEIGHLLIGHYPRDPRPYRHGVKLAFPERGFGVQMDAMLAFLKERNLNYRYRSGKRGTPDYEKVVTWFFPDEETAGEFAKQFDGEYLGVSAPGAH